MPADRAELLALAARAEAGGDRTLSDDVWIMLGWERDTVVVAEVWFGPQPPDDVRDRKVGPRPDLTASIDAQAELPGRVTETGSSFSWKDPRYETEKIWHHYAKVWIEDTPAHGYSHAAPDEPLARLAAKLRALAAATPEAAP